MTVFLGTSGWQYRHWRGGYYPEDIPQRLWLERYTEDFSTVESNNAFYRLPEREQFEKWAGRTPDGFVFAVKVSRFLTHIRRLREPAEPVARYLDRVSGLGDKLGPSLLQLPPTLRADLGLLDETLSEFGRRGPGVRVAVEFRHPSWFGDETRGCLEDHGAALCLADGDLGSDEVKPRRKSMPVSPLWRTAEWGYLRFHHGAADPDPCYGRTALESWAERLSRLFDDSDDVFVYFNNDYNCCAPRDAARFARALFRHGFTPTRTPSTRGITVG